MHILIVINDKYTNNMVTAFLTEKGCTVDQSYSGLEGRNMILQRRYDFILLDSVLPRISSEHLIQNYRKLTCVPIIILTAHENNQTMIFSTTYRYDQNNDNSYCIPALTSR